MGYAPLFDTLTKGTLCGRWPDIGLWPIVLSLTDWRGIVDVTPTYIASVTGLPAEEVVACMKRFCEPDPYSRSTDEKGARLVLLDEHRDWGWRVVNIQVYRDKASGMDQVEDGRNAAKVKRYRDRHRQTPADTGGPSQTPTHTSDSDSDSDSKSKNQEGEVRASRSTHATRLPADFELTPERRAIAETEKVDPAREFAQFTDHWRAAPGAKGRKCDWDATWRNWCRRSPDFKPRGNGRGAAAPVKLRTADEIEAEERTREQH